MCRSGGVYFLISHVLGSRRGAAVGLIYVIGQVTQQWVFPQSLQSKHVHFFAGHRQRPVRHRLRRVDRRPAGPRPLPPDGARGGGRRHRATHARQRSGGQVGHQAAGVGFENEEEKSRAYSCATYSHGNGSIIISSSFEVRLAGHPTPRRGGLCRWVFHPQGSW